LLLRRTQFRPEQPEHSWQASFSRQPFWKSNLTLHLLAEETRGRDKTE
jgi:hypothetical protein